MNGTEIKVVMGGRQVHVINDPPAPPHPLTYLSIPDLERGVGAFKEVYIVKIVNRYPTDLSLNKRTIYECECVAST